MLDIPANNGCGGGHLVAFRRDDRSCVHLHIYCQGVQANNKSAVWMTEKEKENRLVNERQASANDEQRINKGPRRCNQQRLGVQRGAKMAIERRPGEKMPTKGNKGDD